MKATIINLLAVTLEFSSFRNSPTFFVGILVPTLFLAFVSNQHLMKAKIMTTQAAAWQWSHLLDDDRLDFFLADDDDDREISDYLQKIGFENPHRPYQFNTEVSL